MQFHLLLEDSLFKKSFSGTQTSKWNCFNLHNDKAIGLYSVVEYCINQLEIIHECKQDLQFYFLNINILKTFIYFM